MELDNKGINKDIDKLFERREICKKKIQMIDMRIERDKSIIAHLYESIEELRKVGKKCPTCGSKLTEEHEEKNQKE
jgi:DNA repair exonuclease SbcCD ATPase subunit